MYYSLQKGMNRKNLWLSSADSTGARFNCMDNITWNKNGLSYHLLISRTAYVVYLILLLAGTFYVYLYLQAP
jgi:hypothetical protein